MLFRSYDRKYERYERMRDAFRVSGIQTRGDEDNLQESRRAAESAMNKVVSERYKFENLVNEGQKRAAQWKIDSR